MDSLRSVNKYFFKYRYRLISGILFVTLSNVFATMQPIIVREAFNKVETQLKIHQDVSASAQSLLDKNFMTDLMIFGLLILGLALISGFFLFLTRQTIIVMSRLIEYDMKDEIYQHFQNLPASFYRKSNTGDLMARISEDVGKVRMYFGPAVMYGINLIITTVMTIVFMLSVNQELTFYSLIPLPFLSISIYFISKKIEKKSTHLQEALSDVSVQVQEGFSGIRVLKAFANEKLQSATFNSNSENYRQKALSLTRTNSFFHPLMIGLIGISIVMILLVGGFQVVEGKITVGNIAEFVMYITRLTWPVTAVGWVTSIVQRAEASQKRINELLEQKNDIIDGDESLQKLENNIRFENVSFAYPDEPQKLVIKNLSLELEKGSSLGIIGATGSGKSTIIQLLTRTFEVGDGRISLDGQNIKSFKTESLRRLMGLVPQDVFLFSDTIENNILFGADLQKKSNLKRALYVSNLDEALESFPKGLESILGERGISLSGGQKQRTAIARALVREPEILLLDDCLSAVDTHTEHLILERLKEELKGKTTIITSHRVSSVKLADKIAVLENGTIVEIGTHDELISFEGRYKKLYDKQSSLETAFS